MALLLTTDEFAAWFSALGDGWAEEVATALEVILQLAPGRAAPKSSEWLLWYQHPQTLLSGHLPSQLEEWATFRDDAQRVIQHLESPRFAERHRLLGASEAASVAEAIHRIKVMTGVGRRELTTVAHRVLPHWVRSSDHRAELQRCYQVALAAAGFEETDFPAHSAALRQLTLSASAPGMRILYGVDAQREVALVILGEELDRSFYGNSVRHAERLWKLFLEDDQRARELTPLR